MENEEWKDVAGYEGLYIVSDKGRVKGLKSGRILSLNRLNGDGYLQYALRKDGQATEWTAHRLVALNFIGSPTDEKQDTVNHKNGVKTDNRVENLEWTSRSEQMFHAYELGLKKPVYQGCQVLTDEEMDEIKATYKRYKHGYGSPALAEKYGVESTTILRVIDGHYD